MQSPTTTTPSVPGPSPAGSGFLVLVVDDYRDCRDMYAAYLALAGFRVLKASDGVEALDIARRSVPDIVLMDLSLPGIDGYEATRRLRKDPATRDVRVVALTAQSVSNEDALRSAGFDGAIVKPCLPDELAERVGEFIRSARDRSGAA